MLYRNQDIIGAVTSQVDCYIKSLGADCMVKHIDVVDLGMALSFPIYEGAEGGLGCLMPKSDGIDHQR